MKGIVKTDVKAMKRVVHGGATTRIPQGVMNIAGDMCNEDSKVAHRMRLIEAVDRVGSMEKEEGLMLLREASREYELAMEELKEAHEGFLREAETLKKVSTEALSDLRSKRHAMVSESTNSLKALKDVRTFFLDKDYKAERDRLESFVEICERLKVLKDSGFLDTISDTMLNLSK